MEIIKNDKETTKFLNNFSSNIIQNLNILQNDEANSISDSMRDSIKTIVNIGPMLALLQLRLYLKYIFQIFVCREGSHFEKS